MAILITAPLGTGKTLYAMELIFEYLAEGRPVFSNIIGLKIHGALPIDSTSQHPFDWRDLPNDAVLFFDEAHEHPAFSERDLLRNLTIQYFEDELKKVDSLDVSDTKKKQITAQIEKEYAKALKRKKEDILDIGLSMSMHRHFGIEIVLLTQNPTKLNKDILSNVTIHHVMRRKFGFEAANIWTFGEAMTTWGKSVADGALIKKYWKYPKHLYKFYVSSEKHNIKKYFPKKYFLFALIPILIFGKSFVSASDTGFFGLFAKETPAQPPVPEGLEIKEGDTRTQHELLEQHQAAQKGMTVEEYRASQTIPFNPDLECRKAVNLNLPQCVDWFNQLTTSQASFSQGQVVHTVTYDPNSPYDFNPTPTIQPKDFPRMSGVMSLPSGRLIALDQQGNYMQGVSQEDCKKWLSGYRPFDYTKSPQSSSNQPLTNTDTLTENLS